MVTPLTSKEPTIFKLFMHVALFNNVVYPLTFNDDKHVEGLSNTTLLYWSIYNAAPPAPDCNINLLPFADLKTLSL